MSQWIYKSWRCIFLDLLCNIIILLIVGKMGKDKCMHIKTDYELLYADSAAGKVAMTAFDIGLAMGGPEAIAESFYSVMDTQRQHGGQPWDTGRNNTP